MNYINYNEINHIVKCTYLFYMELIREKHSVSYVSYEIMAILDLNNDDKISKQEFMYMLKDKELTQFFSTIV